MPRKKAFKLTRETYYSKDRPHLSQSQLKMYIESPRRYKAYVDGILDREPTRAMRVGKFFDALISEPDEAVKYHIKEKRGDDSPYALTESEFNEAEARAIEVFRHPFWSLKPTTQFQVLLEAAMLEDGTLVKVEDAKGKEHVLVCCLIDRLDIKDRKALLIDFKGTNAYAIETPKRWYYACLDAGYDYQFAFYEQFVKLYYDVDEVICAHVTTCYEEGLATCKLFLFPSDSFPVRYQELVKAAWNIKNEWYPEDRLTWKDAILCGP